MLLLYTKDNCVYCEKVKKTFLEHRVVYEERNIKNPTFLQEAQAHHAMTMPYMFDTSSNTGIQESDEIIDYALEYSF